MQNEDCYKAGAVGRRYLSAATAGVLMVGCDFIAGESSVEEKLAAAKALGFVEARWYAYVLTEVGQRHLRGYRRWLQARQAMAAEVALIARVRICGCAGLYRHRPDLAHLWYTRGGWDGLTVAGLDRREELLAAGSAMVAEEARLQGYLDGQMKQAAEGITARLLA